MKRIIFSYLLLTIICGSYIVTSCSDKNEMVKPEIVADEISKNIEVAWDEIEASVKFTINTDWKVIAVDAAGEICSWMQLGKNQGSSGNISIPILFELNDSETTRTGSIKVMAGDIEESFTILQMANPNAVLTMNESDIVDFDKYYKPAEFQNIDMLRSDAKWSWFRSAQSEHFFVFWESGFGDNPNDESVNPALRVDINDMLEKIEHYYNMNADVLKFVTTGNDKSYLDKYKMEIYLFYQSEWMATGSGYDDVIGALWINPGTCQPVGSTIAHEIGHSFQYQVYCDKLLNGSSNDYTQGFRYGYEGSNGGNGFWEQCAQWQSFQNYPQEAFGYNSVVWRDNYHRHFGHEWMRYASYWLQYYWAQKHGIEVVGEIWNKSYYPEDPLMTYMRLYCNDNLDVLYTELYDYATHMVTYDIDGIRDYKTADANNYSTKLFKGEDDFYQIAYSNCPGTTGFNIIKLNLPQSGKTIDVNFQGLSSASLLDKSDPGNVKDGDGKTVSTTSNYNSTISNGGWRYGFVSVVDGVAVYSPMYQGIKSTVSYLTPVGTSELYFVVMGAPDNYSPHPWNEDELDDEQWPYKVQFVGTDLYGSFYIDTDVEPTDVVFTYNLSGNSSIADYNLGNIDLTSDDAIKSLAQAFVMRTSDLSSNTLDIYGSEGITPTEGKIVLGLLQNDGTYSFNYTASSGFYCTADGDVGTWGNDDPIWIEYDKESFIFTYGHKPGTTVPGQKYTIKPVLIYTKNDIQYKATFIINIQF